MSKNQQHDESGDGDAPVLRAIGRLDRAGGIPLEDVQDEVVPVEMGFREFEAHLQSLLDRGRVYQPRDGYVRATDHPSTSSVGVRW